MLVGWVCDNVNVNLVIRKFHVCYFCNVGDFDEHAGSGVDTCVVVLREMANNLVVKVKRETIAACMTCPLCNKLLRDATTITECLHSCKSLSKIAFLQFVFVSNTISFLIIIFCC